MTGAMALAAFAKAAAVVFLAGEEAFFSTGAVLDVNGASYLRS